MKNLNIWTFWFVSGMHMWAGPRLPYISNNFHFLNRCILQTFDRMRSCVVGGPNPETDVPWHEANEAGYKSVVIWRFLISDSLPKWPEELDDIHSTIWLTQKKSLTWFFYVSSLWSLRFLMSLDIPDVSNEISCCPLTALSECPLRPC